MPAAAFWFALGQIFARVLLAQVQFLRLAAGEFRNMERSRAVALLALHKMSTALRPGIASGRAELFNGCKQRPLFDLNPRNSNSSP